MLLDSSSISVRVLSESIAVFSSKEPEKDSVAKFTDEFLDPRLDKLRAEKALVEQYITSVLDYKINRLRSIKKELKLKDENQSQEQKDQSILLFHLAKELRENKLSKEVNSREFVEIITLWNLCKEDIIQEAVRFRKDAPIWMEQCNYADLLATFVDDFISEGCDGCVIL